jgi:thioredoxin 1
MVERSNRRATETAHLTESTFDEAVAASYGLLMVDFWADWCAPCHVVAPVLEDLAANSGGRVTLAKVNVDENPGLAETYGIRAIPTVLFFRGGEVVERITGAVSKTVLQKILDARA